MVWGGIDFTTDEQGADIGPLEVEADLTETKLTLAYLVGANPWEITSVTTAQVKSAHGNAGTELPDELQ